jgi:GNAT superfamily N-acetyltransferase
VPPLPVTMRVARPSDAATMLRSLHLGFAGYRAFAPAGWSPRPLPNEVELVAERLRDRSSWALLAEVAGEPAGHVALAPDAFRGDTVYLWQLFVRPAWFGTGLAGELHDAFVAEARERGYRAGRLRTPAPHARARRFYERRGWAPAGPPDDLWDFGMPLIDYRCRLVS